MTKGYFPAFSRPSFSHGLIEELLICVEESAGWEETLHLLPSGMSFHLLILTCLVPSQAPDLTSGFTASEAFPVTASEVMHTPNNHSLSPHPIDLLYIPQHYVWPSIVCFPQLGKDSVLFITVLPISSIGLGTGPVGAQYIVNSTAVKKGKKKQRKTETRELNEHRWVCHFFQ